jgi:hypothetical protein
MNGNGALPDIRAIIGSDTALHRVTGHELAGPCPFCGGTDRFRVNIDSNRWWCRQCTLTEHWSDGYEYVQRKEHLSFPEAKQFLERGGFALPAPIMPAAKTPPRGPIVATYDYRDAAGTLLFQACRHEPGEAGKKKSFSQRRPDPDRAGAWIGNLAGVPRVLYRLPELLAAPGRAVFVCEGEKDVDALAGLGLVATCNPLGAGKWEQGYTDALSGRHVVIIADKDDVGRKHAETVKAALAGTAASTVVLEMPGEQVKDSSDWLAAGGTRDQLEQLVTAARKAPRNPRILRLADLLDMTFAPTREILPGVLQEGTALFTGRPKAGKSWTAMHLSFVVAQNGIAFGHIQADGGDVLHLALEDGRKLVQKRFRTLLRGGTVPERLHVATDWPRLGEGGLTQIEEWLQDHPKAAMVVIDTLQAVRGDGDAKKSLYQRDYEALAPLTELAHRYSVAIVIVHHTRKMEAADVMDTISGSTGLTGAVDALMVLSRKRFGPEAVLSITGRDIEEHEMGLLWDQELSQWNHTGSAEELHLSQTQKSILDALEAAGEALGPKEIAERTGLEYNAVRQRMWQMAQAGQIAAASRGKYKLNNSHNNRNIRNFTPENAAEPVTMARNNGRSPMRDDDDVTADCYDECYDAPRQQGGITPDKSYFDELVTNATNVTPVQRNGTGPPDLDDYLGYRPGGAAPF